MIDRSIFFRSILFSAATIFCGLQLCAEPIPVGFATLEVKTGTNTMPVYTYKPKKYNGGPLIMVFHGVLRNADLYQSNAVVIAERFNVIIAAPLFSSNRFSNEAYQRGGVLKEGVAQPRAEWSFELVSKIVDDLRQREVHPNLPYYYIGHSGGGQFVMRLSAFEPGEAKRIVAANPGSDLFPRRDWKYGYGFGGLPPELSDDAALQRYLAAPLTLYLGTGDTDPQHPELDRTKAAMLQGRFRLERGEACFAYAQKLAEEHGWKFNWKKVETPGIGHDASRMFSAKEVGEALFGADKPLPVEK